MTCEACKLLDKEHAWLKLLKAFNNITLINDLLWWQKYFVWAPCRATGGTGCSDLCPQILLSLETCKANKNSSRAQVPCWCACRSACSHLKPFARTVKEIPCHWNVQNQCYALLLYNIALAHLIVVLCWDSSGATAGCDLSGVFPLQHQGRAYTWC